MVVRQRTAQNGSVAEEVRNYIDSRPVVRDAVSMGIVNLSALTRKIMSETGIEQEEAVLVACRRYERPHGGVGFEARIRDVLKRGNLEVRTHAALLNVRPGWDVYHQLERVMGTLSGSHHPLHIIQGADSLTIMTDEGVLSQIEETMGAERVLKRRTQLVELNLRVPEESERIPGIIAFLTTSLAARGINILEAIAVHRDNMFLLEEDDLFEAFGILNGLIRN